MFYALPNRSLLKVKQAIKNHIWVEEASVLRYVPPCFSKETFPQRSSKWDRSPRRDNNLRKTEKKLISEYLNYPEMHTTPPNTTLTKFTRPSRVRILLNTTHEIAAQYLLIQEVLYITQR